MLQEAKRGGVTRTGHERRGHSGRDFARRAIEAELFFESFDLRDCLFAGCSQCHSILSMQIISNRVAIAEQASEMEVWSDGVVQNWIYGVWNDGAMLSSTPTLRHSLLLRKR